VGSGVGESITILLPDDRTIVVDACAVDGINLPAELLRHLGISSIDLLVLTHPDLDHVRGIAQIVDEFKPAEVWRYPLGSAPRDAIAKWATNRNPDLLAALEAMDRSLERTGRVFSVHHGHCWPGDPGVVTLRAIAPTPKDLERMGKVWDRLVGPRPRMRAAIDRWLQEVVSGARPLGDAANVLSIGAVLTWESHKIVLGGDVMRGSRSPFSGWKGIVRILEGRGPADLLSRASLVKVAHHGSRHSFDAEAWSLHSQGGKVRALVAPFRPSGLPDEHCLSDLRSHVCDLGISSLDDRGHARVAAAGWTQDSTKQCSSSAAKYGCCGAILSAGGALRVWSAGDGAAFS
jgi:beta-lactamase superfamily II metal-dependent hydrolase